MLYKWNTNKTINAMKLSFVRSFVPGTILCILSARYSYCTSPDQQGRLSCQCDCKQSKRFIELARIVPRLHFEIILKRDFAGNFKMSVKLFEALSVKEN